MTGFEDGSFGQRREKAGEVLIFFSRYMEINMSEEEQVWKGWAVETRSF